MSFPNIPNISPNIPSSTANLISNREQVRRLLLASIALEELSSAHLLNAEAEKLQTVLGTTNPGRLVGVTANSLTQLLSVNRSVERTLRDLIKHQMLLQFKLEDVLNIPSIRCITEIRDPDGTLRFTVEFVGVSDQTWTYIVTNFPAPGAQDISHWDLSIPCITRANIIAVEPGPFDTSDNFSCPSSDPSCNFNGNNIGIKFDSSVPVGQSITFSFTLNVDIPLGTTCFLIKFGNNTRCGLICGPQCS